MVARRSLQFAAISAATAAMIPLGYHTTATAIAFVSGYAAALIVLYTTE